MFMIRYLILYSFVIIIIAVFSSVGWARDTTSIENIEFAKAIEFKGTKLILKSTHQFRYKRIFKVFAAGLYLEKGFNESSIFDPRVSRRLEIEYMRSFDADDFRTSTSSLIKKNTTHGEFKRIKSQLERFNAFYREVNPGDRYALTYIRGDGITLALNDKLLGKIADAELAMAVFKIWFGNEPFSSRMKADLLSIH